jgi:hypothetical protein
VILILLILLPMLILIIVLTIINVAILWHYNKAQPMLSTVALFICQIYTWLVPHLYKINGMWNEMKWNEMKWTEMQWNEMEVRLLWQMWEEGLGVNFM